MDESGRERRWSGTVMARIHFDDGNACGCVVDEFTTSGAMLKIPPGALLPASFELVFPLTRASFRTFVRWQADQDVRVQFAPLDHQECHGQDDPWDAMVRRELATIGLDHREIHLSPAGTSPLRVARQGSTKQGNGSSKSSGSLRCCRGLPCP